MSFLAFDRIKKSYGDTVAIRDVSFEVQEGEVFGLLGPNGAGKTSLIRILMDIIRPNEGTITLFGESHSRDHLDRVGYLPEERGLYTKHKVLEVLTYFGMLKGLSRAEARSRSRHWLDKVGLAEVGGWKVERLSKGMGQKVQIASTLLFEPELCVLDEPFAGLDPVNVRLVQDLIQDRRSAGQTTILSTHQMNMVEALCDRVALIHKGEVVIYGEVSDVRHRYSLPEVRVGLDGPLPRVEGVERSTRENDSTWRLLLAGDTQPTSILADLVGKGAQVNRFERVLASMEEIFIRVVEGQA